MQSFFNYKGVRNRQTEGQKAEVFTEGATVVLTPAELMNSASKSSPTIIRKENKVGERIFLSILAPEVFIAKLRMVWDKTVADHHKIRSARIKRS